MNHNYFSSYINSVVYSLNQCNSHLSTVADYSNRLKSLADKTTESLSSIETSFKKFSDILIPIHSETTDNYLRYKNSIECAQLLEHFVKLSDSLKIITKIILKDGLGQNNKEEYFESVKKIKRSIDFYHVNAPGNPHLKEWKSLMGDATKVLHNEVDIELNNSSCYNEEKLHTAVYSWIDSNVRCEVSDKDANFINQSSVDNLASIIKLLDECEELQSAIDSYTTRRCSLYQKVFDMFKREDKHGDDTKLSSNALNARHPSRSPSLRMKKSNRSISGIIRNTTSFYGTNEKPKEEGYKNFVFDYLAAINAAFVLMFKFEIKYASLIIPELHFNSVLSNIYSYCIKHFQVEVETASLYLTNIYQNGDVASLASMFKSILPVITFTFHLQQELLNYAKGSAFVPVRKAIAQYFQPIETIIVSASQEYRKLIAMICEKGTTPILINGGIFDYVLFSQEFFLTISSYSKSFAFCFFRLVKNVTFAEFDLNWFSYLHNYTNTSFDILRESITKNCEKMDIPLKTITVMNNFEFLLDYMNMEDISEIFSKDYRSATISNIKKYIKYEIGLYRETWDKIFQEIYDHMLTVQKDLKDAQVYGKQLNSGRKSSTKTYFKNLNSSIEALAKKHEGLSFYNARVSEQILHMLQDDVLAKYTLIYQCFIDVPFSSNNRKHIKYDTEQFQQLLEKLVWTTTTPLNPETPVSQANLTITLNPE